MPTYVGDGRVCGLDSDSDGLPDEGLDCNQPFCTKVRAKIISLWLNG